MVNCGSSAGSIAQDLSLLLPSQVLKLFALNSDFFQKEISKSIKVIDYFLGEEVLTYSSAGSDEKTGWAGIVCSGRVRLLVRDRDKEITAELLEVDRCFGAILS